MALDKTALKNEFIALYNSAREGNGISDESMAESMANIIDAYIKSGTVNTQILGIQATGAPFPPGPGIIK